jgi:putative transposase
MLPDPVACQCLLKDRGDFLVFYGFPAKHWHHICFTNPIGSTFANVRQQRKRTKECGSRLAAETMVFKPCMEAEKRWRQLQGGYQRLAEVSQGVNFRDGFTEEEWLQREAA